MAHNASKLPGERFYIDLAWIRTRSYSGSQYWCLAVDDCTGMCWSVFMKHKSELAEKLIDFQNNFWF